MNVNDMIESMSSMIILLGNVLTFFFDIIGISMTMVMVEVVRYET